MDGSSLISVNSVSELEDMQQTLKADNIFRTKNMGRLRVNWINTYPNHSGTNVIPVLTRAVTENRFYFATGGTV